MRGNPLTDLNAFHYALSRDGKRADTVIFYARTQREADKKALAWVKSNETVRRIRAPR